MFCGARKNAPKTSNNAVATEAAIRVAERLSLLKFPGFGTISITIVFTILHPGRLIFTVSPLPTRLVFITKPFSSAFFSTPIPSVNSIAMGEFIAFSGWRSNLNRKKVAM